MSPPGRPKGDYRSAQHEGSPVSLHPGRWWHSPWVWRIATAVALGLVFATYLQPDLMFDLANRVWSCF